MRPRAVGSGWWWKSRLGRVLVCTTTIRMRTMATRIIAGWCYSLVRMVVWPTIITKLLAQRLFWIGAVHDKLEHSKLLPVVPRVVSLVGKVQFPRTVKHIPSRLVIKSMTNLPTAGQNHTTKTKRRTGVIIGITNVSPLVMLGMTLMPNMWIPSRNPIRAETHVKNIIKKKSRHTRNTCSSSSSSSIVMTIWIIFKLFISIMIEYYLIYFYSSGFRVIDLLIETAWRCTSIASSSIVAVDWIGLPSARLSSYKAVTARKAVTAQLYIIIRLCNSRNILWCIIVTRKYINSSSIMCVVNKSTDKR